VLELHDQFLLIYLATVYPHFVVTIIVTHAPSKALFALLHDDSSTAKGLNTEFVCVVTIHFDFSSFQKFVPTEHHGQLSFHESFHSSHL
jgi:hypothetical protein